MSKLLEEHDYETAAYTLDCDVAAIKAVAEVESREMVFCKMVNPKFFLKGIYFINIQRANIKTPIQLFATPRGRRNIILAGKEYTRLEQAEQLDKHAARMSASYGKFQIMGFNFAACGFSTVDEFYDAMQLDEKSQLEAFCEYIKHVGLNNALREHKWESFAKAYNGPEYWKNKYHIKLANAYDKYSKED